MKSVYLTWHKIHIILPQVNRYTLGNKVDKLFIEIIENVASAAFAQKELRLPCIRLSIRKLDVLKIMLLVLWETKSIDNKQYVSLSEPIDEVGRMLGGWHNQTIKQTPLP